ncbi:MAG: hypothetical protein ACRDQU_00515 [Pseudonocardiaceae bacterium]
MKPFAYQAAGDAATAVRSVAADPAVVNAVHHATGVRVRDLPVTLDKVLAQLPPN